MNDDIRRFMAKSQKSLKVLLSLIIPLIVFAVLFSVYDFSLQSYVTFAIYTLLGLVAAVSIFKLVSAPKRLYFPFIVFETTYLSVYGISFLLHLNTSLFDFVKGVAFSFIAFATVASTKVAIPFIRKRSFYQLGKILFALILFIAVALPLIMICYLVATGSLISSDIILALAQTNASEGKEFFNANFNFRWVISFVVLVAVYFINYHAFNYTIHCKEDKGLNLFSLILVMYVSVFFALPRMDYLPFSVIKITSRQLDNFDAYKQQKGQRLEKLSKLKALKLCDEFNDNRSLFVLVIGESETRDRMQAYGFKRSNTPKLIQRLQNPHNILFKNAFSSWPQTVQALSYALTQANQYNHIDTVDAYSLIEMARASDFDTYWLSNQRKYGVYETPITVVASTAHNEIWTNGSAKMEGVFFDQELVNQFPKIKMDRNTLIVIHLMGSHQKYQKRLPKDFMIFKGDDEDNDYYDDTILYTDYIVDEIYKKASQSKYFKALVYVSDHGEDPHLVGGHDPLNVTRQMLQVPLTVYLSDSFVEQRPHAYEALIENSDKYWSNDLTFDLMMGLMGLEGVPSYDPKYDLSSKSYDLKPEEVLTMYGKKRVIDDLDAKK